MKKLFASRRFLPIALPLIFIVCLLFGSFATLAFPIIFQQRSYMLNDSREIARLYIEAPNETPEFDIASDMRVYICDRDGSLLQYLEPLVALAGTENVAYQKYLPQILNGEEICLPIFMPDMFDLVVLAGVSLTSGGNIVGAVFIAKNLKNLPEAAVSFAICFTVLYWLGACLIIAYSHGKRKLYELRQNYVDNVAHALKTPLSSIKALTETLYDGVEPDPQKQKQYLKMILQEAERQEHMVLDILAISKIQDKGFNFSLENVNAEDIFLPVLDKYSIQCERNNISLNVSDSISTLPQLYTKAECISQVLDILFNNAIKFTHKNGNIWLDAQIYKKHMAISVKDDGIGIEQDALPQIFDRFYKYNHDFNESGSGLGLAIAHEIINGLKERIWVESKPGHGSIFYFSVRIK